jgi:hypothetical protein
LLNWILIMGWTKNSSVPLLAILFLASGCGKAGLAPEQDQGRFDLTRIYQAYMAYLKSNEKPPAGLGDLEQIESVYPDAIRVVREGAYLVNWGVTERSSQVVLAYQKDGPEQGGLVVRGDGTVKKMTAEQIRAAAKPNS